MEWTIPRGNGRCMGSLIHAEGGSCSVSANTRPNFLAKAHPRNQVRHQRVDQVWNKLHLEQV